ncbi:MAG: hypothetical protein LBF75_04560, partial [Treponema sp.]|jgi:hypothetical protein|nr:hypothetical protein [Treponema sp.]
LFENLKNDIITQDILLGIVGMLFVGQIKSTMPTFTSSYELDAITGGISMGIGTLLIDRKRIRLGLGLC